MPCAYAETFVAAQKEVLISYGTPHPGNIDDVSGFMCSMQGGMQTQKMVLFVGGELVAQVVAGAGDVAALNPAVARSQINAGDV